MSHLKSLASPKTLKIHRKETNWVMKSAPGAHPLNASIPLGVLLRNQLGVASNRKEVNFILHNKGILVNGKVITEDKLPVGLLDFVEIVSLEKVYIIKVDHKGRLFAEEVDKTKTSEKVSKIVDKTMLKSGKIQVNLYDGRNILIDAKDSKKYPVGASIVFKFPEFKISSILKRENGNLALVAKGRHAGKIGKIEDISKSGLNLQSLTTIDVDGEKVITNTDYIFVVGEKESKI